jgi:Phosphoglycerate dehydrogenase and related dehydrogenases
LIYSPVSSIDGENATTATKTSSNPCDAMFDIITHSAIISATNDAAPTDNPAMFLRADFNAASPAIPMNSADADDTAHTTSTIETSFALTRIATVTASKMTPIAMCAAERIFFGAVLFVFFGIFVFILIFRFFGLWRVEFLPVLWYTFTIEILTHEVTNMNVLVVLPLEDEGKARIEAIGRGWNFAYDVNETTAAAADVVIGNLPVHLIKHAVNLKWIQLSMAGTDAYSAPGVLSGETLLTNVTGAFGHAISEHMVGCVFSIYKKLHLYRDNQNKLEWATRGKVKSIKDSVVLSVGMGDIGGNFLKRMKALESYTIGICRTPTDKPSYADEIYTSDKLDEILPRADIVALSMPNTPQTRGMFSRERLAMMKDGAVIVNIGRGNAIDTDALCDALDSGKLLGAAVDVTDPEPLPANHRLWKCENAIVTPHISGFFHMRETYDNIVDICIENFKRYVNGAEMMNVIDMSTGYRAK